jgi:hypothetical protein
MIYSQKMSMGLLTTAVDNFQMENRGDMPKYIMLNKKDFKVICKVILKIANTSMESLTQNACFFMGVKVLRTKDLKRSEVLMIK